MKPLIYLSLFLCLCISIHAQQNKTTKEADVIIFSNDADLTPEDIEITIKKEGKKVKVKPENIKIVPPTDNLYSLKFGDFNAFEIPQFNMDQMRMRMQDLLQQFDIESSIDNFQWNTAPRENIEDFNREFEELGVDSEINEIELGDKNHNYLFKSDDGRPILQEEKKIIIEKDHTASENGYDILGEINTSSVKPLVFLNGKEYHGNIQDIDQSTIQSMEVEKGTAVVRKFGEKGKGGVVYIQTKK